MKSDKGITIVSLMVYIIVLSIVIGTVSLLIKYFYKNENETAVQRNASSEYSKFVAYITDDINSEKIKQVKLESNKDLKLIYDDESIHEYRIEGKKLFNIVTDAEGERKKKIELCSNVENATFEYNNNTITTTMTIGTLLYTNNFTVK